MEVASLASFIDSTCVESYHISTWLYRKAFGYTEGWEEVGGSPSMLRSVWYCLICTFHVYP